MLRPDSYDSGADDALKDVVEGLEILYDETLGENDAYSAGLRDAIRLVKDKRIELYG